MKPGILVRVAAAALATGLGPASDLGPPSGPALPPTWTPQTSGVTSRLRGVSAASARVAWASGARGTVLRTTDAGDTWSRLVVPDAAGLDFRDVDAVSETTAYILSIGAGASSRIYKTSDSGATWTLQFTNDDPKAFFDAMIFRDEAHGIAVSDSVEGHFLVLRTDDGRAWQRVPAEGLPAALDNEGFFAASGTNVAVRGDRVWFATGAAARARVVRSIDRGRTWQVAETPIASGTSAGIYSIAFRDERHGVVVGGDYTREGDAIDNVAITSDGGMTWTGVTGSGLSGFRSVVAHVPGTAASFVAIGPSGADMSTDDGRTWTPLAGQGYDTFSFAPGRPVGWAAGARGRIAKLVW